MSEEERKAMNEDEIKFRAYLLILNSEFPTHRKKEAMEELLKINNKQQKEIERLNSIIKTDNIINKETAKLIEQQQKEIEEWKKLHNNLSNTYDNLSNTYDNMLDIVENDFIEKDKIRELIKEKAKTDTYNYKTVAVKDIEELLEE